MGRINIELPSELHSELKQISAAKFLSIRSYIVTRLAAELGSGGAV